MFVSFLGLGQGGSNVAEVAAVNGFYSGAINYSSKDLESLTEVHHKLTLIGSEGVGKQRSEAIRLMSSNWDLATNFVKENFSHPSIQIIFVPFSTGGGSGSGIAPVLLNMLIDLMPDKVFVAMPIIPDLTEAYTNQVNCLDTFEDLSQLDVSILPIDNEQLRSSSSSVGKVNLLRKTNEKVIQLINEVINYTEKPSPYSVLDKKDFLNIFRAKGFACISEVQITDLSIPFEVSETSFSEKIQSSWETSPFAKIEYEQIVSAGLIFDGQEKLMDCLNMNKVFSKFKNKMPISLFEGSYTNNKGKVISILSGLTICKRRLDQIEDMIEESQESVNALSNVQKEYKSRIGKRPIEQQNEKRKQPTVKDISAMINKFKR